jgi:sulfur carrier protein ThiS
MHRGSSKAARGDPPTTETLPLSASTASSLSVEVEVARAGRVESHALHLAPGTTVREAVRAAGLAPEGTAVFLDEESVPLDAPLDRACRLIVVPTFSGG